MTLARLTNRALSEPIRLKADRFEALVAAHEAFLAGRTGGRRATLGFIVASGFSCERRNLADARFDGSDFSETSFVGCDFSRASLYCCNLQGCDFRGARLQRADVRGATFAGASLAGANLDGADMRAAVLWASDEVLGLRWISGRSAAGGQDVDAEGGVAHGVDFSNASLQGARLRDANLKNANFTGANLAGAELIGAKLDGVRLKGAILTGIEVARLGVPAAALQGCVVDPTEAAIARLDDIKRELDRTQDWITRGGKPAALDGFDLRPAADLFQSRLLAGLHAKQSVAIGVDFSFAKLQGANFDGADLRAATFVGADLRGASFVGANLAHAFFDKADLGKLELRPGMALATRFDGAILDGTVLNPASDQPADGSSSR
jgi:uncharacterized protein YjbI with pentapeptide repeats